MSGYCTYMSGLEDEIESVELKLKTLYERLESEVNEDLCIHLLHEIVRLGCIREGLLTERVAAEAWNAEGVPVWQQ